MRQLVLELWVWGVFGHSKRVSQLFEDIKFGEVTFCQYEGQTNCQDWRKYMIYWYNTRFKPRVLISDRVYKYFFIWVSCIYPEMVLTTPFPGLGARP